ncbi:zinc finger CCCH domain-containing protein 11A-like [Mizuhopecten yessoensis]|uniref:Zinc finger CCCH domain-containing protein 11A n=1 Tax=Mizuhopecten yessoensis TaxID=6573 RepID=A0A210PV94_MIZYE|nr:zinc finger CCCH domain-containing protein 11A-like [Mizuhopecten yessoensis]XP_021374497.1 zinc finger CCCH domain-containing protein 11A-like [Mizuhopecten yessoensis]OWF40385.1 Zinc finger CCCH domain-containing protein 11A [Mizuhopecten yessoensis]
MSKSNDDCFYFFSSSCAKGDQCVYRHCEAARQSTVTCVYWKQNRCKTDDCRYRHSETIEPIIQNKAELPCYFESIASGCTRPMCPFQHLKPRPKNIPKTSSSSANIITLVDATEEDEMSQPMPGSLAETHSNYSLPSDIGPVIDPIIVNPGEDSDFDSPYNSPVKSIVYKSASVSNNIDLTSRKDLTFQEPEEKNNLPVADPENKAPSPTLPEPSIKTSPPLKPSLKRKAISSSDLSKTPLQVKKTSPTTKSSQKIRKVSAKQVGAGTRPSITRRTKQPDKKAVTPQQKRARKAVATAKEHSKHVGLVSKSAQSLEQAKQHTVKKDNNPVAVDPKVISLKKKEAEKKEDVKTTDEENSDEDLGIKSLEQTLRERALRSMGIIELKSGRVVRIKDQPEKKEEPVKRRRRSSDGDKRKSDTSERKSTEKLPVHKRIGTSKRTPPSRKRSIEERSSQARNKEREERIKRLKLEQERENKRREIIAAKRKARALKAAKATVVKKEEVEEESDSEEESSVSEVEEAEVSEGEKSASEGSSDEGEKEEEEDIGEEVDIELGEGEPETSEEEEEEVKKEVPVKFVFDTRRAIRKSDSFENFTIKKSIPIQPVKAKVIEEVTIKKTFVVPPKEEKEKPKRKRRVILEDDEPVSAPLPIFSVRSNITKPKEVQKKTVEVKKPKLAKTKEEQRPESVVRPMVKPVVAISAPKVKTINVWNRRAWDSRPKESGDSADSRLGGIRSRLGVPGAPTGGCAGDQETGSKEAEPKIKKRLGWRKTPVVSAEDNTDSDSTKAVKKSVSLAAIRAKVGHRQPAGSDEDLTVVHSETSEEMSAATKKYRQPIQIYVPPAKKRTSVPDDEEPIKRRLVEKNMEGLKDQIKPKEVKTFVQIMAEKREQQKILVEKQKNTLASLGGSPGKKVLRPVKFGIDEKDLADVKVKSRLPGESPLSMPVSNSVQSSSSSLSISSSSRHMPVSSSHSDSTVTSSNSKTWSFIEKEQKHVAPISSKSSHGTPASIDNKGDDAPELDNLFTERNGTLGKPQTSVFKAAPTFAVSEVSSTQDLNAAGDGSAGLSQYRDQVNIAASSPPSNKMESINTIAVDIREEEENVSPAKRSSHNDSWLDIDISDLDEDITEDETNDDDLLREIDELLA